MRTAIHAFNERRFESLDQTLRQTLIGASLSRQRTRSWKWSPDPHFQAQAERGLGLYCEQPEDGVVVCFDEMGPIQLVTNQTNGIHFNALDRQRLRRARYQGNDQTIPEEVTAA